LSVKPFIGVITFLSIWDYFKKLTKRRVCERRSSSTNHNTMAHHGAIVHLDTALFVG
jgi:hypothetical protein